MEHPNGDVPAILDDEIIRVAEQAEKRIEAIKKIKTIALRVTNAKDWVDQNDRPYLQASGAEKVARLFGINWKIEMKGREDFTDGHYAYEYVGEFTFKGSKIEAMGSRNSRDPFFSVRYKWNDETKKKEPYDVPPTEIDSTDVKKAAYTNCVGNGVTRILGIRNLTWEEIEEVTGITKAQVVSIHYGRKKGGKAQGKKSPSGSKDGKLTQGQKKALEAKIGKEGIDREKFKAFLKVKSLNDVPVETASEILNDFQTALMNYNNWSKLHDQAQELKEQEKAQDPNAIICPEGGLAEGKPVDPDAALCASCDMKAKCGPRQEWEHGRAA